jgi:hypothetical protein
MKCHQVILVLFFQSCSRQTSGSKQPVATSGGSHLGPLTDLAERCEFLSLEVVRWMQVLKDSKKHGRRQLFVHYQVRLPISPKSQLRYPDKMHFVDFKVASRLVPCSTTSRQGWELLIASSCFHTLQQRAPHITACTSGDESDLMNFGTGSISLKKKPLLRSSPQRGRAKP